MVKTLSHAGLRSEHCYTAGLASIALTWVAHAISWGAKDDSKAQADRWGIYIGEWAPTFFALGIALKLEESCEH
ncbi:hypothetical protein [Arsenicicoccus dermatophilus]|uniref:hypothetical protein n=1 Tax=Arsenicicoccus dermatophilus TaxID=1076331 RepID=UPI00391756E3